VAVHLLDGHYLINLKGARPVQL